jgi:enterochelin esterase-like enzyme
MLSKSHQPASGIRWGLLALVLLAGLAACRQVPEGGAPISVPTPAPVAASATPILPPTSTSTSSLMPAQTEACPPGRLESGSLDTDDLSRPLRFQVYLPPCYDSRPDLRYPVLYLLHGQTYDENQWVRLGAIDAAGRLIASGEAPPFLIVLPYDPDWVAQPSESGFDEALLDGLLPYVDAAYRTLPDRSGRAVGGLSRGAGWAIHLALNHPAVFGAFGAHSPVIFWRDGSHVNAWLAAIPSRLLPSAYVDIGESDAGVEEAREFEELLNAADVPHEWHLNTGTHDEAYWSAHVEEYLRWYASLWQGTP